MMIILIIIVSFLPQFQYIQMDRVGVVHPHHHLVQEQQLCNGRDRKRGRREKERQERKKEREIVIQLFIINKQMSGL
jgi:type IV secretory pathway VirD2 relaxase